MEIHYNRDTLLWRYDKRRIYPSGVYPVGHGVYKAELVVNGKSFKDIDSNTGNYTPSFINLIYPGPVFDEDIVLVKWYENIASPPAAGSFDYEFGLFAEDKSSVYWLTSNSLSAGDLPSYSESTSVTAINSALESGKRLWMGIFTHNTSGPLFDPTGTHLVLGFEFIKRGA